MDATQAPFVGEWRHRGRAVGCCWERDGLEGAGMDVEAEEIVAFGAYEDVVFILPFLVF
jgi:hypothetical protein